MLSKERLDIIRQIVKNDRKIFVSKLSNQFDVTEETIRRDLEKLESEGLITRTYGGAVLNNEKTMEGVHYYKRAGINSEEKQLIAEKAQECIKDCAIIGFDSSTTAMGMIRLLREREDLTIVTNSAVALNELDQAKARILSTGGFLNRNTLSLQGSAAVNTAKSYNLDAVVISCKGISKSKGISDSDEMEAEVKRQFVEHAGRVILLVDHTKFDRVAFVELVSFDKIDLLVTDREPSPDWLDMLQEHNVEVIF